MNTKINNQKMGILLVMIMAALALVIMSFGVNALECGGRRPGGCWSSCWDCVDNDPDDHLNTCSKDMCGDAVGSDFSHDTSYSYPLEGLLMCYGPTAFLSDYECCEYQQIRHSASLLPNPTSPYYDFSTANYDQECCALNSNPCTIFRRVYSYISKYDGKPDTMPVEDISTCCVEPKRICAPEYFENATGCYEDKIESYTVPWDFTVGGVDYTVDTTAVANQTCYECDISYGNPRFSQTCTDEGNTSCCYGKCYNATTHHCCGSWCHPLLCPNGESVCLDFPVCNYYGTCDYQDCYDSDENNVMDSCCVSETCDTNENGIQETCCSGNQKCCYPKDPNENPGVNKECVNPGETDCTDGWDNDCDGKTDCADADCEAEECDYSGTCGACVRTSPKIGKKCCGKKDACDEVISSFINDTCQDEWEEVDYNTYCYTGTCETNNAPYLDRDNECSQTLPIKILGNPENPAAFQRIYYLDKGDDPDVTGIDSCSEGFEAPYIDGGHCGHHPPPDVDRVETPKDDLECLINDTWTGPDGASEVLSTNTDCYNLTVKDIPLEDLPRAVSGTFECKDDGIIEGHCTGENIKTSSTSKGFTICPCGEIDLGSHSFKVKNNPISWILGATGSLSFDVDPISTRIGPNEPCCGWPLFTAKIKISKANGKWMDIIYKKIAPKIKIKNFDLMDFFPPYPPGKTGTYISKKTKGYNVEITITFECKNITISSQWSYKLKTGNVWATKTGGSTSTYPITTKSSAIAILNGLHYIPEPSIKYKIVYINDNYNETLFNKFGSCCPVHDGTAPAGGGLSTSSVSSPSTYIVNSYYSPVTGSGYFIGPSDVLFNPPATVTYKYSQEAIPDFNRPLLYRFEDDYIEHACQGQYTDTETVQSAIGQAGGTIASQDGNFALEIPPNALDRPVGFTISKRTLNCYLNQYTQCSSNSGCGSDYSSGLYCIGNNVYTDYHQFMCVHTGTVSSYCSEKTYSVLEDLCAVNETCEYGQCAGVSCTNDSDGGIDIYTRGIIDNTNYTDICLNSTALIELYCSNTIKLSLASCPEICSSGRCTNRATMQEVLDLIDLWVSGAATIDDVIIAVEDWINS